MPKLLPEWRERQCDAEGRCAAKKAEREEDTHVCSYAAGSEERTHWLDGWFTVWDERNKDKCFPAHIVEYNSKE